jgi:hypothetical protein
VAVPNAQASKTGANRAVKAAISFEVFLTLLAHSRAAAAAPPIPPANPISLAARVP